MTKAGNSQIMRAIPLLITIFSLSLPAYAQYSGGTGEPNEPYQIATVEDLMLLGETPVDYDKNFILTADIDLNPNLPGRKVFDQAVIAHGTCNASGWWIQGPFKGVFDGKGHSILNLKIVGENYLGIFGRLGHKAEVRNLGAVDVKITGSGSDIGSLVGYNGGYIENCSSSGRVTGNRSIGGLVGTNIVGRATRYELLVGIINKCSSSCQVRGEIQVGGLVGLNENDIYESYSSGAVNGVSEVGGLVGVNTNGGPMFAYIYSSYSTGSVKGNNVVGGLVGSSYGGTMEECYSKGAVFGERNVGGLVGEGGDSNASFWDVETSGQISSTVGTGKTTTEMHTATTFLNAGWDFVGETVNGPNDIWKISEGLDYPRLWWEKYGGGRGEPNNPYLIYTAEHLNELGAERNDYDKHFKLMADIDFSGYLYERAVIAPDMIDSDLQHQGKPFTGVLDGNGHAILNLTIEGHSFLGLFGYLDGDAIVSNLSIEAADVNGVSVFVGSLAGFSYGSVIGCCCSGDVSGNDDVGGLLGSNTIGGKITNCYSTVTVNGNEKVGGLVGYTKGSVTMCYSTGMVISEGQNTGGLVGERNPSYGIVTECFWDTQTSGQATSAGGTGKITAELQTASTFLEAGWDFVGETGNGPNDIWKMWDGFDYPRLTWEPGPNTPLVFVDINDPGFYGQMSKCEVTNAQYCDFLNAALASGDITVNGTDVEGASGSNSGEDYAGQRYYRGDGSGYTGYGATNGGAARIHHSEGAFSVDGGFGNHPVTYVSWYGAMAFANYYGYYLPAEDQWQAVADYDGTYIYGCGQIIDPGIANYRNSEHADGTTSVGSFGQHGYDMSDMAGNVWEWTSSSLGSNRVFRGGSLGSIESDCDVSIRGDGIPYAAYYDIGFRVCR